MSNSRDDKKSQPQRPPPLPGLGLPGAAPNPIPYPGQTPNPGASVEDEEDKKPAPPGPSGP